jgi:hypothetical protein
MKISMKISMMDRSMYFKGLLLLIRKDQVVEEEEIALMMRIGRFFSFEKKFCRRTIDEILTNPHIVDDPPLFSDPAISRCFIKDGMKLSLVDGHLHESEWRWLKAVAAKNNLDRNWCEEVLLQATSDQAQGVLGDALEAECFVW